MSSTASSTIRQGPARSPADAFRPPAAPAGAAANADVVGSAYRPVLQVAESGTADRGWRSLRPLEFLNRWLSRFNANTARLNRCSG
jgi:hypothetical protein